MDDGQGSGPAHWLELARSNPTLSALIVGALLLACVAGVLTVPRLGRPAAPQGTGNSQGVLPSEPSAGPAAPTRSPNELNILLLGIDERPGDTCWRSDTIIIAAVRPDQNMIGLFSIPRDLWVTIPGKGEERINTVDFWGEYTRGKGGGPALLQETLQPYLNIPFDGYVRIRFDGLVKVIDALGGVTITSNLDIPRWGIVKGTQHLDGATALGYARDREYTSDLDRTRRQQQLLLAMRAAAARPSVILQLPRLGMALKDTVETDLDPGKAFQLANLALRLDPDSIRTCVFDTSMVTDWTTESGAMVLLPEWDRIQQAWQELLAPAAPTSASVN